MIVFGLKIASAIPLFLAIIAILVLLYIFALRRRRVVVPYVEIWRRVATRGARKRAWLRRFFSWLLWVLIVALLILALVDLRIKESVELGVSEVIVVDTSASMCAFTDATQKHRRIDIARQNIRERIEKMGINDRALILDAHARLSAQPTELTGDTEQLLAITDALDCHATTLDVDEALSFALAIIKDKTRPRISLHSDGVFTQPKFDLPGDIEFIPKWIDATGDNVVLRTLSARALRSDRQNYQLFALIYNDSDQSATGKLALYHTQAQTGTQDARIRDQLIDTYPFTLPPRTEVPIVIDNLPIGTSTLKGQLHLDQPDALALDNIAYVSIPNVEKQRVLVIGPEDLFLEAALLLNDNINASFLRSDDPILQQENGTLIPPTLDGKAFFDVYILNNATGTATLLAPPNTDAIYIRPTAEQCPYAPKAVKRPLIERTQRRHPLMKWLQLDDLNIDNSLIFQKVTRRAKAVARSIEGALIVAEQNGPTERICLGFAPTDSDIVFRVALPLLFINALDWMRERGEDLIDGYPTGESWHVTVDRRATQIDVQTPRGLWHRNLPQHEGAITLYGDEPGFYQVKSTIGKNLQLSIITSNFQSASESEIARDPSRLLPPERRLKRTEMTEIAAPTWWQRLLTQRWLLWMLAVMVVLGLLGVEWLTFHRRWTV